MLAWRQWRGSRYFHHRGRFSASLLYEVFSIPLEATYSSPTAEYTLSNPRKTIARLERGGSFPPVSAIRGWTHNDDVTLVSGRDWTHDVMNLARAIGYTFTSDTRKDAKRGQAKQIPLEPRAKPPYYVISIYQITSTS
jgi:hypothetical protein